MSVIEVTPRGFVPTATAVESDELRSELRGAVEALESTFATYDARKAEVRADPGLNDHGRREALQKLAADFAPAAEKAAGKSTIGRIRVEVEMFRRKMFARPQAEGNARAGIRSWEIRSLLREMAAEPGGELKVKRALYDAAKSGDLETFKAIVNAPAAFPLVDDGTAKEALELRAQTEDPEGYEEYRDGVAALNALLFNRQLALEELEKASGGAVRAKPDPWADVFQEIAATEPMTEPTESGGTDDEN